MILKFTINGTDHEIDFDRVMNVEAIEAQKVTGEDSWTKVCQRIDAGDFTAVTAIVYIAMRRKNPELRFKDVEFTMADWRSREWIDPDAVEGDDTDPPVDPVGSDSD